jgi:hypothetical protein
MRMGALYDTTVRTVSTSSPRAMPSEHTSLAASSPSPQGHQSSWATTNTVGANGQLHVARTQRREHGGALGLRELAGKLGRGHGAHQLQQATQAVKTPPRHGGHVVSPNVDGGARTAADRCVASTDDVKQTVVPQSRVASRCSSARGLSPSLSQTTAYSWPTVRELKHACTWVRAPPSAPHRQGRWQHKARPSSVRSAHGIVARCNQAQAGNLGRVACQCR